MQKQKHSLASKLLLGLTVLFFYLPIIYIVVFSFNDSRSLTHFSGFSLQYKNEAAHKYYLLVSKSRQTPEEFNKVCNILSEYGTQQTYTPAAGAFMKEHYQVILKNHALQTLAEL